MSWDFSFMLPISIGIATIAMASGVEGATFFTPLFILALGLPPEVAVGTGLITETFGFASGLYAYFRKGLIDFGLGTRLLIVSIPAALLGTWLSGQIPEGILKGILGVGLAVLAISFWLPPRPEMQLQSSGDPSLNQNLRTLTAKNGTAFCYVVNQPKEGLLLSGMGGLFMGMLSTGLGQMNGYYLLRRSRIPSPVAVATSVFVVAITAWVAATGHLLQFLYSGREALPTILNLVIFTAPGVVIGGQMGSLLVTQLPQKILERGMGILFLGVSVLLLVETLFL